MSYDISLIDPVTYEPIILEDLHKIKGGTYAVSGTHQAWINITYNYAMWYRKDGVFPTKAGKRMGIRTIYGMSGAESIPIIKNAISALERCKEDISDEQRRKCEEQGATGYWMPTRANAIKPLYGLLAFAQMRPDGVWEGD